MAHTINATKPTALPNNPRSFTTIGSPATPDSNHIGTTSITASLERPNNVWGSNNIWGNGASGNVLTSRAATRDNSTSRDVSNHVGRVQAAEVENKTGSASLVDSSTTDEWSYRASWGAKRSLPSARSISQTAYPDMTYPQNRSVSHAGLPQNFSAAPQGFATLPLPPPTIKLGATAGAQSRTGFVPAFSNSSTNRVSEPPPTVYTKFERPADPNSRKLPDSAKGLWSDTSPTDERNVQSAWRAGARGSVPNSRTTSQAPSHHSDDRPLFTHPDYSRPSQRQSYTNSRTTSLSSQGNNSYASYMNANADQLAHQLHQLSMNADSRPPSSYKPPVNSASAFSQLNSAHSSRPSYSAPNGLASTIDSSDDWKDVGNTNFDCIGADGFFSPRHPQTYADYASNSRILQPSATQTGRQAQPYTNGNGKTSSWDVSLGARPYDNWLTGSNTSALAANVPPQTAAPHDPYLDPRLQHMLGTTLRSAYPSIYGQYALPPSMQPGVPPPFPTYVPIGLFNIDGNNNPQEASIGDSICSPLMYEFKANTKSRRYELKDIYDHIAEFSGDQHGSRFIQNKLETANSDEKERVFREIAPNAIPLMTDVFGNYVIQKFFEHGDQTHKKALANKMKGHVLTLSLQMYGCRVVQKALDHVLVDQQAQLIRELESHVLKCVKDQNGNHVIQKAIERCPANTIDFIIKAFEGQVQHLSIHPYGCRVIQRCLERCEPQPKSIIMHELMSGIQGMVSDQYGNYVVQHIVEHDQGDAKRLVLDIVGSSLESYSKHKFASNVVEKCLAKADDKWRQQVVFTLANEEQRRCDGEGVVVGLVKDNFGNYVIQKLLDTLCAEDYSHFLELLQPAMAQAKRTGCGKQVLTIEKKMQRFPYLRNSVGNGRPFSNGMFQSPVPSTPFASNYGSTTTTPPPLMLDTQSLQSSAIQSVNGDAVEGAAPASRKGSDLSIDAHYAR